MSKESIIDLFMSALPKNSSGCFPNDGLNGFFILSPSLHTSSYFCDHCRLLHTFCQVIKLCHKIKKSSQTITVASFHVGAADGNVTTVGCFSPYRGLNRRVNMELLTGIEPVNLLITNEVLYRLSYSSILATQNGLEPSASSVTGWRSNQLNYWATHQSMLTYNTIKCKQKRMQIFANLYMAI